MSTQKLKTYYANVTIHLTPSPCRKIYAKKYRNLTPYIYIRSRGLQQLNKDQNMSERERKTNNGGHIFS